MSNHQLYVHLPNAIRGPFTVKQMQQGAAKGQVTPQHQVSYDGKTPFPAAQIWSTLVPDAEPTQAPAQAALPKAQPAPKSQVLPKQVAQPVAAAAPSFGPPISEPQGVSVGVGGFPVIDTGAAPSVGPMINVGSKMSESEKVAKRQAEEADGGEKKEEDTPMGTIIWGAVLIALGIGLYFWFDHIEQQGGRIKMNWLIILAYKTLGKFGVLGILSAIGLFAMISGASAMAKGKKKM